MLFKSEQVKFVEIDQTLSSEVARKYESAMNAPSPAPDAGYDPFAGGSFSSDEFGNPSFQ